MPPVPSAASSVVSTLCLCSYQGVGRACCGQSRASPPAASWRAPVCGLYLMETLCGTKNKPENQTHLSISIRWINISKTDAQGGQIPTAKFLT